MIYLICRPAIPELVEHGSVLGYIRVVRRAIALLVLTCPAYAQTITGSAEVEVDGKVEHVRQINGRWWSDDNRQMFPPAKKDDLMWIINPKTPGLVFYHHRPVQLARAESLHLFMTPETVRQVLGEPNQILTGLRDGQPGFYFYYAANGTSVTVRFMQNHLLGEAKYDHVGGRPLGGTMVGSIDRDLAGRSIYKILSDQASAEVAQRAADHHPMLSHSSPTMTASTSANVAPYEPPQPPARRITADDWKKVALGMTRDAVIAQLGEPLSSSQISGLDPPVEILQYAFVPEGDAKVRLENGKVIRLAIDGDQQ